MVRTTPGKHPKTASDLQKHPREKTAIFRFCGSARSRVDSGIRPGFLMPRDLSATNRIWTRITKKQQPEKILPEAAIARKLCGRGREVADVHDGVVAFWSHKIKRGTVKASAVVLGKIKENAVSPTCHFSGGPVLARRWDLDPSIYFRKIL